VSRDFDELIEEAMAGHADDMLHHLRGKTW
jgi:hypothetical protein